MRVLPPLAGTHLVLHRNPTWEGEQVSSLPHYDGPSRLCCFNLALKLDDAATEVNSLTLDCNESR